MKGLQGTGDGGCCIIDSLVSTQTSILVSGQSRGAFRCCALRSCVSSQLHSLVTTCHNLCHATVPPYSLWLCHLSFVGIKVTGLQMRCRIYIWNILVILVILFVYTSGTHSKQNGSQLRVYLSFCHYFVANSHHHCTNPCAVYQIRCFPHRLTKGARNLIIREMTPITKHHNGLCDIL